MQTIGRAARNLHGRAILYADVVTKSMHRAIQETDRRRAKQQEYNEKHHITPTGIQKAVHGMIENSVKVHEAEVAALDILSMTPKALEKKLNELEKTMFLAAKNLDFEKAAMIRDQIANTKKKYYGVL